MKRFIALFAAVPLLFALTALRPADPSPAEPTRAQPSQAEPARTETAVFAGGCFWSMEKAFEHVPGVQSAVSGFIGGTTANPTYNETLRNPNGHVEAVEVTFDPDAISYQTLVRHFWHNVDPTTSDRQFCDQGATYRAALFPTGAAQRRVATESLRLVEARLDAPVVATVRASAPFYAAEDYHQDFADRNPERYAQYNRGCRRGARLTQIWGAAAGTAGARI